MQFCDECDSVLLPKKKSKNELWCRICEKSFKIGKKEGKKLDYKIGHKISHTNRAKTAIVEKVVHKTITEGERRAHEDYFRGGGD